MTENEFNKSDIFVFGYGSLMFSIGMNGRGMDYVYADSDMVPARLRGYRRGMYAAWGLKLFYGIVEDDNSYLNGTLTQIYSFHDFMALNISEKADVYGSSARPEPGNYVVVEVTDIVTCDDGTPFIEKYPTARCFSYVVIDRNMEAEHAGETGWYEPYVDTGMQHLGKKFVEEFKKTSTNKS